jgi:tRNA1(Val) A37 N6-methylase TrmN6
MARKAGSVNYNERSWAIDLIGHLKKLSDEGGQPVRDAGGELTISTGSGSRFPDVLLYGDLDSARILQGWELKMPDTPIDDIAFVDDAVDKANLLGLDSFVLWNVSEAVLYTRVEDQNFGLKYRWSDLVDIRTRTAALGARARWEKLAAEILAYVNDLFARNALEGRRFIDSYRSGGITELIFRNTGSVAETLIAKADSDGTFRAEVTVWWTRNKAEYGSSRNKFEVLAQSILSDWIGKFLFAQVLQARREEAHVVNEIGSDHTPEQALEVFQALSQQCNFFTIFGPALGSECLSDQAWLDLRQFNILLSSLRLGGIEQLQLSDMLESSVEVSRRKIKGQYPTPANLAHLLVDLCIDDITSSRVLDPCAGSGTISRAALELKLSHGVPGEEASSQVIAGDIDPQTLQIATFALARPELMTHPIRVFNADAFTLTEDTVLKLRDPNTGEAFTEALGTFDAVTSNLPFVSQDGRQQYGAAIAKVNASFGEEGSLTGRADVAAYLPFALHDLIKPEGKLGIIITNAWLATSWGLDFQDRLRNFYHLEIVVTSGAGRWFKNADIVTNILVLSPRTGEIDEQEETKFITLLRPLEELSEIEYIEEVSALIKVGQAQEDVIDCHSVSLAELREFRPLGLGGTAQFGNIDWVLELPLIPVSRYFDIARGERRGWNAMFYPEEGHGIEPEFLQPVVKNARNLVSYLGRPDAEAFCCSLTEGELQEVGAKGALAWIERFWHVTNNAGVLLTECLARANMHWYEMRPDTRADLAIFLNPSLRLFFSRFANPTFVDQRLVRLSVKDGCDLDLSAALLNSSISYLMVEGNGFGRGLGVLDLSVTNLRTHLHMLDPSVLTREKRDKILQSYQPLLARDVEEIADELERDDRRTFDKTILEAFGIETPLITIYDTILRLVEIRQTVLDNYSD